MVILKVTLTIIVDDPKIHSDLVGKFDRIDDQNIKGYLVDPFHPLHEINWVIAERNTEKD